MMTLKMATLIHEQLTWYLEDRRDERFNYEVAKAKALLNGEEAPDPLNTSPLLLEMDIRILDRITGILADGIAIGEADHMDPEEEAPIKMTVGTLVDIHNKLYQAFSCLRDRVRKAEQEILEGNASPDRLKELRDEIDRNQERVIEVNRLVIELKNTDVF